MPIDKEIVMAKQKSEFVSALGTAFEVVKGLAEEVYALNGNDEHIRRVLKDRSLLRDFAIKLVGQSTNGTGDTYKVTVDYSQTLEQMIAAGRYDGSNSDITDKHFPTEGSGQSQVEIILRHYNKVMSKDAVLADLDKDGLRPATLEELLALGANEKTWNLQRQFPIIALGSVWEDLDGNRGCPVLNGYGSERYLDLDWFDYGVDEVCRFAAVRK